MNPIPLSALDPKTQAKLQAQMDKEDGTEGKAKEKAKKPSKYHNTRTPYNGRIYDSKHEAQRAAMLDLLVKAQVEEDGGVYHHWVPQPVYFLPDVTSTYRPDFLVFIKLPTGDDHFKVWCEDVKGAETDKFKADKRRWRRHGKLPLRVLKKRQEGFEIVETIEPGGNHGQSDE